MSGTGAAKARARNRIPWGNCTEKNVGKKADVFDLGGEVVSNGLPSFARAEQLCLNAAALFQNLQDESMHLAATERKNQVGLFRTWFAIARAFGWMSARETVPALQYGGADLQYECAGLMGTGRQDGGTELQYGGTERLYSGPRAQTARAGTQHRPRGTSSPPFFSFFLAAILQQQTAWCILYPSFLTGVWPLLSAGCSATVGRVCAAAHRQVPAYDALRDSRPGLHLLSARWRNQRHAQESTTISRQFAPGVVCAPVYGGIGVISGGARDIDGGRRSVTRAPLARRARTIQSHAVRKGMSLTFVVGLQSEILEGSTVYLRAGQHELEETLYLHRSVRVQSSEDAP
eukprot:1762151-Rhodomonas_salina.2